MLRDIGLRTSDVVSCRKECGTTHRKSCSAAQNMRRRAYRHDRIGRLSVIMSLLVIVGVLLSSNVAQADDTTSYTNSETGYEAIIVDEADLLTEDEEQELMETYMEPVTTYGNVVFYSSSSYNSSTSKTAENKYLDLFGNTSGTLFFVDMYNRYIYIFNHNDVADIITSSYSDTITDNVYKYASDGDYLSCAGKAFEQEYTLLEGGKIAQPMKHICNVLIAILLGFLLNYIVLKVMSHSSEASASELLLGAKVDAHVENLDINFTNQTRTYSPQSSGGGGGGGGHRGGGGGGGHSSGGGHRF